VSRRTTSAAEDATVSASSALVDALQGHLQSLRTLVASLPEHTYRSAPRSSSGSTGEHVRHCLDHARALVASIPVRVLSYDSRLRGTPVETQPWTAIEEIDSLCIALGGLEEADMTLALSLETRTHRQGPPVRVQTTIGRELAFVAQHTVHHCATLAVLLEGMGIVVPPQFGYAPSTPNPRRTVPASR
jgi:hypothetical protein